MIKRLKQCYTYKGRQYKLPQVKKFIDFTGIRNIFGSLVVTTKQEFLLRLYLYEIVTKRANVCIF
ncbi:hypothetical protein D3Z36_02385 [Lachnospiraceae bacterium]|nr:hypothetical protein [Lachnospiraceae bacterium]